MKATHLLIEGVVQGVGFRFFAERAGRRLGVRGYVRNLPDGRVEVVAAAAPGVVSLFVEEMRRGPRGARVQSVMRSEIDLADEPMGFEVRA